MLTKPDKILHKSKTDNWSSEDVYACNIVHSDPEQQ